MELRQLRAFAVLAEELHFGRAAARLGISQPPLSQTIMALERELGAQLFQRNRRAVALTRTGELFLPEARRTLEQAERSALVARRAAGGELGELRVGLFGSAPLSPRVAGAIGAFRRTAPDVRLTPFELSTAQQIAALGRGGLDIGFLRVPRRPVLPAGIVASEVCREALFAVMPEDHPLAGTDAPLPVAALAEEPLVFFSRSVSTTLYDQVYALCQEAGFAPRISQEANTNSMIVGLVLAQLGITVLPAALCELVAPRLRSRRLDALNAVTAVWVAHPDPAEAPLVARFLACMPPE